MANKAVTVRLDEQDIRDLDSLAERAATSSWLAERMRAPVKPTRSDMIRVCVKSWLADEDADAAAVRAARDEPGEIPWEQIKAEAGLE